MREVFCRVCGWSDGGVRWEDGVGSFDICDCCGCEAGYEDVTPEGARGHRERWLAEGTPGFDRRARPDGWEWRDQLDRVPEAFR